MRDDLPRRRSIFGARIAAVFRDLIGCGSIRLAIFPRRNDFTQERLDAQRTHGRLVVAKVELRRVTKIDPPREMVPHLASHLLARVAPVVSADWQMLYQHPIDLLETFIDPWRFRGSCYRAANWIYLGQTTGRGKADLTHRANRSLKELWVHPITKDFRQQLCQGRGG